MARIRKGGHGGRRADAGRKKGSRWPRRATVRSKNLKGHGGGRIGAGRRRSKSENWCLYIVHELDSPAVCKIGITGSDPLTRLGGLQVGNWRPLMMAAVVPVSSEVQALEIERAVHQKFSEHWVSGEWFRVESQVALKAIKNAAGTAIGAPLLQLSLFNPEEN